VESPNGSVNTTSSMLSDVGAAIGGPIVRDRLFFFGAIDPSYERKTMTAPTNRDEAGSPLFALSSLGEVDRVRQIVNYAAKGTWQMASNHRLEVSAFGDPANGDLGPQRTTALLATTTSRYSELTKYGGNNQAVRYQATLTPRWLLEAAVAHAHNEIQETPSVNEWSVTDRTVTPNIVSGGIGAYEAGNISKSWQYQVVGTTLAAGHEFRYGVHYDRLNYDQVNQRTGPTFTTPVGDQTATGAQIQILSDPNFGRIYRVVRANLNSSRSTSQDYWSAFVQDTWKVGNRLTIKPGIRYEQQTLNGTLVEDFKLDNNWAPRVGATFDPAGNGKSKLYGSYGLFFQRIPNDLAARALSADAGIGADYFDAQLTQPIPNGVLAGPVGSQTATHYSIAGELVEGGQLQLIHQYLV
jgi:hypothetical protein